MTAGIRQRRNLPHGLAVLTNDYDSSYEAINLMARHNIPYRVLHSADVKVHDLEGFEVVIAFATPSKELTANISEFAERGGVAVLVNVPGAYPGIHPARAARTRKHERAFGIVPGGKRPSN